MNKYLVLYICFSFTIYIHKVHFLGIKHRETRPNWTSIIKLVMDLKTGNNLAEVEKETILDLLKRMK